jgi:putative transposase
MSNYRRFRLCGATYFFTVALADRRTSLLSDHIGLLRQAYALTIADMPLRCDAMVVLPGHLHAVWTLPEGDCAYSRRWGSIKARFVMSLRRAGFSPPPELPVVRSGRYAGLKPGLRMSKRESAVWQRRFWEHTIRDEADFQTHVAYCWSDPVRHGLVKRAADWPFSSIHRDIHLGRVGADWARPVPDGNFGE